MKLRNAFFIVLIGTTILAGCHSEKNQKPEYSIYQQKVDSLIKIMTLDEKIGQLNLLSSGWDVTGPTMNENYKQLIREGKAGGVFNAITVKYVTELQQLAVEETRLGIPLLFG